MSYESIMKAAQSMSDRDILVGVIECMDGKEWNADTLEAIAQVLEAGGIVLREYNPNGNCGGD